MILNDIQGKTHNSNISELLTSWSGWYALITLNKISHPLWECVVGKMYTTCEVIHVGYHCLLSWNTIRYYTGSATGSQLYYYIIIMNTFSPCCNCSLHIERMILRLTHCSAENYTNTAIYTFMYCLTTYTPQTVHISVPM